MNLRDLLLLGIFALACTLLYLLIGLIPRSNRCRSGFCALLFGALAAALCTGAVWYFAFLGPLSRNWGLGGSYLWMLCCPGFYLLSGLLITRRNATKGVSHDQHP